MATGGPTLEVRGVEKSYGTTPALAGVDLTVEPGTIVGLLGPNGAGKSTLVSIVAGLRRPDAGSVHVGGIDVARDPKGAQRLIGLAPQDTGVYLLLSVRDNLRFFGGLAGLRGTVLQERVDEVAASLGLTELLGRLASQVSGGERRRLHAGMALMHHPRLVLLDEPTVGADVRTRQEILELVRRLAREGSAVVYSTHYLTEIEELDARVELVDRGRIVARGALDELIREHGTSALVLTFEHDAPATARLDGALVEGASVRIQTPDPARTAAELLPRLGADAEHLLTIEVERPSLESVFLAVTGRRYDEREVA
jgi:ABC-2 type transport system ATP-binding protein